MKSLLFQNQRRTLFTVSGVVLVLLLFMTFSSYGLLTISSSDPEVKNVYIKNENGVKELSLGKDSKTLLLRRSDYVIEVSREDKLSLYNLSLGSLRNNRLEIDLPAQNSSLYRGKSDLPCSIPTSAETISYYSCSPSSSDIVSSASVGETHSGATISRPTPDTTLKPYKSGFLELKDAGSSVSIRARDASGAYGAAKPLKISDFRGKISDATLVVNKTLDEFAVFEARKNIIRLFSGPANANSINFQIDEGLVTDNPNYDIAVSLGRDNIYVFSYIGYPDLDASEESLPPQAILIYSKSGKLVKKHDLPTTWSIRNIVASPANELLFLANTEEGAQTYVISAKEGLRNLNIPSSPAEEACWKNSDIFYYLSDGGTKIYYYSLSKKVAYLAYSGLVDGGVISRLNCASNYPGFILSLEGDGETSNYIHYGLGKGRHKGTRIESLLPLYLEIAGDTLKLSPAKNGVVVDTIYDDPSSAAPSRDQVESLFKKRLLEKGVSAESISIYNVN